jgi:hypothetical protein
MWKRTEVPLVRRGVGLVGWHVGRRAAVVADHGESGAQGGGDLVGQPRHVVGGQWLAERLHQQQRPVAVDAQAGFAFGNAVQQAVAVRAFGGAARQQVRAAGDRGGQRRGPAHAGPIMAGSGRRSSRGLRIRRQRATVPG